jgi:hypothetical protein
MFEVTNSKRHLGVADAKYAIFVSKEKVSKSLATYGRPPATEGLMKASLAYLPIPERVNFLDLNSRSAPGWEFR